MTVARPPTTGAIETPSGDAQWPRTLALVNDRTIRTVLSLHSELARASAVSTRKTRSSRSTSRSLRLERASERADARTCPSPARAH